MPVLSAANRSQLAYKLEGVYPTNFGVTMSAGNGTLVNLTGESLTYDIKTEMSKNLRADRGITSHVQVGATATGDINIEQMYRDYDPFLESLFGTNFVAYGTDGISAAMNLTMTATTITAGAATVGVDDLSTLRQGAWFSIVPPVAATQAQKLYLRGRVFRVSSTVAPTSTVVTVDPATPINNTLVPSLTGAQISSSYLLTGGTMKSFNLEVQHLDTNQFRLYRGQIPGKMNLKLASGSLVNGSISFMGKDMVLAQASTMGTPVQPQPFPSANATRGVFDVIEGGVSLSATTYIKSADLTFDGSLRTQEAIGVFGAAGIAPGTFKMGGSLEVYFADEQMYEKFLDNTTTSLSIPVLDIDGNGYVYVFPKFTYTAAKVNATGQDTDNMLSMNFETDVDTVSTSATYLAMAAIYRVGAARV